MQGSVRIAHPGLARIKIERVRFAYALLLDEIPLKGWIELRTDALRFVSESSNTVRETSLWKIVEGGNVSRKTFI